MRLFQHSGTDPVLVYFPAFVLQNYKYLCLCFAV
jgi:hypothetical protein